jgi:tyrosyl-tRNA synthetase
LGDPAKRAAAKAAAAAKKGLVTQSDGSVAGKDADDGTVGNSPEESLKKLNIDEEKS